MNNNSALQDKIEALEQLLDVQEKSIIEQTEKLYNEIEKREKTEKQLQFSNAELEISEKRYHTLFDNAAEGILVAGIQSKKIKFANPAICHLLGYTQEELLQLDVSAIHPRETLVRVIAEFEALTREGKKSVEDLPCLRKNGTVVYADLKATQMVIDNESCIVGFFSDITERKGLENQARERMKELQAFYGLVEIIGREGVTLDKQYQEFTDILPQSWRYTEIACARIVIGDSEFRTKNFMESAWKLSAPVKVHKSVVGRIDVCYLEERPELDEGPFLKEERLLLYAIAERLGHITERKRIEERMRFFALAVEASFDAIGMSTPDGRHYYQNRAFNDLFGNVGENPPATLYADEQVGREVFRTIMGGNPWIGEVKMKAKAGELLDILLRAYAIKDDTEKILGLVGVHTNITERKMYQEQLERKNREILEFTDIVTHDLKKPLAIMKTICNLVANESVCTLKADGREAIAMGKDAIGYMHELLEDLLACAKLEAGTHTMEYEDIDFSDLLEMVLQRFKLQAEEKNIKITKNVSGVIHADRKGMTKVFMNLIGNAVNYIGAPLNPKIIISSSFRETDNSTLFSIKDNGIGIPADIQKDIFQKFKRGANVGGISGTGLGLSIVKGIVEAHGGKIWLESKEGEGTTFYFTVPASVHEK